MTNREKYGEQILDLMEGDSCRIAIQNGIPVKCVSLSCSKCDFYSVPNCDKAMGSWLKEEYKKSEIDWSKVPVDTPVLVWQDGERCKYKRHFAKYQNENIYCWNSGLTSWSASDDCCKWDNANLAKPNPEYYKEEK